MNERISRHAYKKAGFSSADHIGGLGNELAQARRKSEALKTDEQSQADRRERILRQKLTLRQRRAPPVTLAGRGL